MAAKSPERRKWENGRNQAEADRFGLEAREEVVLNNALIGRKKRSYESIDWPQKGAKGAKTEGLGQCIDWPQKDAKGAKKRQ